MPATAQLPQSPDETRAVAASELKALAAGCQATWRAVVARHNPLLHHVARQFRLSSEECADVVQETWARLLLHVDDIREPEHVQAWLVTTARRLCLIACRRRQRECPLSDGELDVAEVWDLDGRLDRQRQLAGLRRAVAALPRRERELMEALLEPEPLSYAQISGRLSMPVGSIGPTRSRALQHLRDLMITQPAHATVTRVPSQRVPAAALRRAA